MKHFGSLKYVQYIFKQGDEDTTKITLKPTFKLNLTVMSEK